MQNMLLPVIPKLVRACDALELRAKMEEEIGMGEQHPVKKADIVDLHEIEHYEKADEELPKAVFHAVPRGENKRAREHQNRKYADDPANHMRAAEPLLLIGYRVKIFFGRGGEELLVLNEADSAVQQQEIRRHDDKRRE